jgi:hypothetical protein
MTLDRRRSHRMTRRSRFDARGSVKLHVWAPGVERFGRTAFLQTLQRALSS